MFIALSGGVDRHDGRLDATIFISGVVIVQRCCCCDLGLCFVKFGFVQERVQKLLAKQAAAPDTSESLPAAPASPASSSKSSTSS